MMKRTSILLILLLLALLPLDGCGRRKLTPERLAANARAAAEEGSMKKLAKALRDGADAQTVDVDGSTLLMLAARSGNAENVQRLLEAGCDVRAVNSYGDTAFHWAAACGRIDVLELLLKAGAEKDAKNIFGQTPLMAAIGAEDVETVARLLSAGASCETRSDGGRTALMWAVQSGNMPILRLLLDRGANPSARDAEGRDVLTLALRADEPGMVKALLFRLNGTLPPGALHHAVSAGAQNTLPILLKFKPPLESHDAQGRTVLQIALESGRLEIIRQLLAAGASTKGIARRDLKDYGQETRDLLIQYGAPAN